MTRGGVGSGLVGWGGTARSPMWARVVVHLGDREDRVELVTEKRGVVILTYYVGAGRGVGWSKAYLNAQNPTVFDERSAEVLTNA